MRTSRASSRKCPTTVIACGLSRWGACRSSDQWKGAPADRTGMGGPILFSVPMPPDFVVAGSNAAADAIHGITPNYATAILDRDGRTLIQGQPLCRPLVGGPANLSWADKSLG